MFRGLHHPGVVVPDLDQAVEFYCSLAGYEKVRETTWDEEHANFNQIVGLEKSAARLCMLKGATGFLELFQYSAPASGSKPNQQYANDYGIRHLCFEVDDVASALERVVALGGSRINPPVTNDAGITATYCRDPFGNLLELIAPVPGGVFQSLKSLVEDR